MDHQAWQTHCESGEATPVNLHDEGILANIPVEDPEPLVDWRNGAARGVLTGVVLGLCMWYGIYRIIMAAVND